MSETDVPCPFCGGADLYVEDIGEGDEGESIYAVICGGCAANGPMKAATPEGAIEDWNRRAAPARVH